jgi:hypothetical protein
VTQLIARAERCRSEPLRVELRIVGLALSVDRRIGPDGRPSARSERTTREEKRGERDANSSCGSHIPVMGRDGIDHHQFFCTEPVTRRDRSLCCSRCFGQHEVTMRGAVSVVGKRELSL